MWLILGEKVKARRLAGGRTARHVCDECGAEADFHECEVTTAIQAYFVDVLDETTRMMVCGECGAQLATDELGEREAGEAAVEGEVLPARSRTALAPRRGDEVTRPVGGSAMGGGDGKRPGIFGRLSRLIKGSAGAAVERGVNPAKEIEQLVLDMEDELRKARGETTRIMASRKRAAARIVELEKESALWTERAEKAVRAGDDELAKLALQRRVETDEKLAEAKREEREASDYAAKLQASLKAIEGKLKDIKMRKGTIKAKVQSQRGVEVRAEAFDEFDRMAGRVDDSESAVDAEAELAAEGRTEEKDAHVERKFAALERKGGPSSEIDERLAALKKKMEK